MAAASTEYLTIRFFFVSLTKLLELILVHLLEVVLAISKVLYKDLNNLKFCLSLAISYTSDFQPEYRGTVVCHKNF